MFRAGGVFFFFFFFPLCLLVAMRLSHLGFMKEKEVERSEREFEEEMERRVNVGVSNHVTFAIVFECECKQK